MVKAPLIALIRNVLLAAGGARSFLRQGCFDLGTQ
jgi:hypothetical protein